MKTTVTGKPAHGDMRAKTVLVTGVSATMSSCQCGECEGGCESSNGG